MNFGWSMQTLPAVKKVLRENLGRIVDIEIATPEEDMRQATDLKVVIKGGSVAVRVRRDDCWFRDVTFRAVAGGYETEIDKIRKGNGDWFLYGISDGSDELKDWVLIDLRKMRSSGLIHEDRPIRMNRDGRTGFVWFTFDELIKRGCMTARKAKA